MSTALIRLFHRFPSLRPYALVFSALAILVLFFAVPLLIMLAYSFAQRGTYGGIRPIEDIRQYLLSVEWISNYVRSLEPIYLEIYARSLWMAVATTVLCLVI